MHNVEKIKALRIYAAAAAAFVLSAVFCVAVIKSGSGDTEAAELISGGEDRPVIVIDAGHGGVDDGASASDGTAEKDINLAIALRLRDIISEYPAEVVLTRENDDELLEGYDGKGGRKRYDMENRVMIIENCDPDLVVSIHLNSFPQDETVHGAQTFYPEKNTDDGAATSSREFARCVQSSLSENIPGSESRQAMAKTGIYLFENVRQPVILVECGFLSNKEEADLLKTAEYQEKTAFAIWEGINMKMGLKKNKKSVDNFLLTN